MVFHRMLCRDTVGSAWYNAYSTVHCSGANGTTGAHTRVSGKRWLVGWPGAGTAEPVRRAREKGRDSHAGDWDRAAAAAALAGRGPLGGWLGWAGRRRACASARARARAVTNPNAAKAAAQRHSGGKAGDSNTDTVRQTGRHTHRHRHRQADDRSHTFPLSTLVTLLS